MPLIVPLTIRKHAMQDCSSGAKTTNKTLYRLRSQRYLRHKNNSPFTLLQNTIYRLQVHLSLATARDTIKKNHMLFALALLCGLHCLKNILQGILLLRHQLKMLSRQYFIISQRVTPLGLLCDDKKSILLKRLDRRCGAAATLLQDAQFDTALKYNSPHHIQLLPFKPLHIRLCESVSRTHHRCRQVCLPLSTDSSWQKSPQDLFSARKIIGRNPVRKFEQLRRQKRAGAHHLKQRFELREIRASCDFHHIARPARAAERDIHTRSHSDC